MSDGQHASRGGFDVIHAENRFMKKTSKPGARRGGFTLTEIAIATIIIAMSLASLMAALRSSTSVNFTSGKMTSASFLAQNIHEWTLRLPFRPGSEFGIDPEELQYLEDLNGRTFSPPRDGTGIPINNYVGWSQTVTLTWLNPHHLAERVDPGSDDVIHVSVEIKYNDNPVMTLRYMIFKLSGSSSSSGP